MTQNTKSAENPYATNRIGPVNAPRDPDPAAPKSSRQESEGDLRCRRGSR